MGLYVAVYGESRPDMTEMRSVWLRLEAVSVSVEECWAEAGWRAGANSWFSSDQAAAPLPHQISPQQSADNHFYVHYNNVMLVYLKV